MSFIAPFSGVFGFAGCTSLTQAISASGDNDLSVWDQ
jgi:hypothetical protein